MAKPRVFVSSTYYDLKYIRENLSHFIHDLGFEPVISEKGGVPYDHVGPLDESCYREIGNCHIFVLIIGGRYGSRSSKDSSRELGTDELKKYNSVTKVEYETARRNDIPIFIFIERQVAAEFETFRRNVNVKIAFAHVDNPMVFELINDINDQPRNNAIIVIFRSMKISKNGSGSNGQVCFVNY